MFDLDLTANNLSFFIIDNFYFGNYYTYYLIKKSDT